MTTEHTITVTFDHSDDFDPETKALGVKEYTAIVTGGRVSIRRDGAEVDAGCWEDGMIRDTSQNLVGGVYELLDEAIADVDDDDNSLPTFPGWTYDDIGLGEGSYRADDEAAPYCVATGIDNGVRWARVMYATDFVPASETVYEGDDAIEDAINKTERMNER